MNDRLSYVKFPTNYQLRPYCAGNRIQKPRLPLARARLSPDRSRFSQSIYDKFAAMNSENDTLTPGFEDDLAEPYVHTVSTEEFVEAVEQESRNEHDDRPASYADPSGDC